MLQDTYRDTIIDVYRDERGTVQRKQIKVGIHFQFKELRKTDGAIGL